LDSVALLDPLQLLPALEWSTRDHLYSLASRFRSQTGFNLRIRPLGGRRTCAEQNQIYAQGRESSGEIVTYASGCRSWHVLGRAADMDPVSDAGQMGGESLYRTAGGIWEAMGGKWGGNFPGFADIGHFEWHPGLTIERVCPSSAYCDAITASIQTEAPLIPAMIFGVAIAGGGYFAVKRYRPEWLPRFLR
jgi:hypothetical protein